MYSYWPPHIAEKNQDDQFEHTYSSCVSIRDVALKTCQRRWTLGKSGERGSGISVLAARHGDDDDDDDCYTACEFFISALADGLLQEFEYQQVPSDLQNLSHYSGRSQECYSLNGFRFNSFRPLSKHLGTVSSVPITTGIITFMFKSFFLVPWQDLSTCLSSLSLNFILW